MRYALYDTYETEIEPGEMICTSDSMAEIQAVAKAYSRETDGECNLFIMEKVDT